VKKRLLKLLMVLALGAVICQPGMVSAGTMFYNESLFLSNIQPGYYLEDFGTYTFGSYVGDPLTFASGSFSYIMSADADKGGLYSGDSSMGTYDNVATMTINFSASPTPITAVGGQFFPTDWEGLDISGTVRVAFADGSTKDLTMTSTRPYFGYTSNQAIGSMTIVVTDPNIEPWQYQTIDHFSVGSAVVVPLPPTVLMLGSGLVGLVGLRYRRKRQG
jgi:hypothetical protein